MLPKDIEAKECQKTQNSLFMYLYWRVAWISPQQWILDVPTLWFISVSLLTASYFVSPTMQALAWRMMRSSDHGFFRATNNKGEPQRAPCQENIIPALRACAAIKPFVSVIGPLLLLHLWFFHLHYKAHCVSRKAVFSVFTFPLFDRICIQSRDSGINRTPQRNAP